RAAHFIPALPSLIFCSISSAQQSAALFSLSPPQEFRLCPPQIFIWTDTQRL
ncbi:hypothetical protein CHARACLAT_000760, partial [Characodon lateralis]|nr:hypothetical protein [Characodon lateralis]